jgi:hypothetical protein
MRIINDKLFSETVDYLTTRPYGEVAGGIANLTNAPDSTKLFEELAACIRTGQVPQGAVPQMLHADPAFAVFYQALTEKLKA